MSTESLIARYPLKREKIIKKTLGWVIGLALGIGIFGLMVGAAATAFIPLPVMVALLLVFLLIILAVAYWYESEYFKRYFYDLTEEGIAISKGVFTTHGIIVPPQKVQDVYLDQDVLDRVFGLWDLHISSATESSGMDAHIDGVSRENALTLRELLMESFAPDSKKPADAKKEADATALGRGGAVLREIKPNGMGVASLLLGNILGFAFLLWVFLNVWPIAVIIAVGGLAWAYLDFTVLRFELREEGVFIRRGFVTRSENLFLYRNIQDVEEIASIWDRALGLKTLSIKTMTASSVASAQMPFISGDIAPKFRMEIIALAKKESQKAEKKAREERAPLSRAAGKPRAFSMKVGEEPSFERPKIAEKEMPYPNKFYRGALYSSAVSGTAVLAIWVFISLVLLLLNQFGLVILALILALLAMALFLFASYFFAFLSELSLRYTVSTDFMLIKTGILNIAKKQVNYNKIQDVEKHTSFTQSFAGLSSVKLETGSREVVGSKGETASAVTQNETVPDLNSKDAEELKQTILRQMCISSKGIGVNPLVIRLPLESTKPLKKTVWWIVYSAIILMIVATMAFLFARNLLWLPFLLFAFLSSACILKYVYELYYYKRYFYDLNDDMLVISKGVFGNRELTVPFDKIQDVFIDRDWLDLAFGLYDVYVTTVSSRSILNAHIDGVSEKSAEQIAELILKKIRA